MFNFVTTAALAAAGRCLSSFATAILARRVVMPLLYADERMLRDVGLSRADIVDSLSSPLRADPSQLLIARINERREGASKVLDAARKAATAANDAKSYAATPKQSLAA